jgi:hypothetical protein
MTLLSALTKLWAGQGGVVVLTVNLILLLAAFVTAVAAAIGKSPLWVSVILLCILELLHVLPLR